MRRKPSAFPDHDSHAVRLAWWVSFLTTIALVAILGLARSAQAAAPPLGSGPLSALTSPLGASPEESGDEAEDEEGEECEEEDEEGECEEEGEARSSEAAEPCLLESASARVVVLRAREEVRLALRYTASSPALVSVQYSLRGTKGALKMGGESSRFSRDGVFRDIEALDRAKMVKVSAATEFDVRLHAVNTPGSCHRLLDRSLTARHASARGAVWTG